MLTLSGLATAINAQYVGDDQSFQGASIDTRTLRSGQIYIALVGENFDGHQFIPQAIAKGASAIVVSQQQQHLTIPQIVVDDTTRALGQLAKLWRQQFNIPVVAITGSCGKTTTKEMIASILKQRGKVCYTHLNLNNHIGAPLTLLQLDASHQYAVLEVGTSYPGEIAYLADIVQPTVAVITNIRGVHLESLHSLDGIAEEKSAIYQGLSEDGIAIINHDEPYAKKWHKLIGNRHNVSFASKNKADITAEHYHYGNTGVFLDVITPLGKQAIAVPLFGDHILEDSLAAIATTMALGATLHNVAQGLASVSSSPGRFCRHILPDDTILIDDTYNGSIDACKSAIKTLERFDGKRIFVMSHIAELGQYTKSYHAELGQYAKTHNVHHLLLTGDAKALSFTQQKAGKIAQVFNDKPAVVAALRPLLGKGTMVIIKGSHSMNMETIVKELI